MRVLITGVTGFAGSHLAEFILAEHPDAEVFGTMRWRSRTENIRDVESKIQLLECDLRDLSSAKQLMERVNPDRIFHLAAQSFVPSSWNAPAESLTTNIIGQLNVFESVRAMKTDPWIQIACSSEEYGMVYENELPIKETNPLRPPSPYAVMYVGNLEARRDFTDVRDMVRGYWLALDGNCEPGEAYNLCSGTDYCIQDVLDMLIEMSGQKVEVREDPERLRPSDVPVLLGDASKFKAATGWEPTIPYEQTLQDMLDYWRAEIR